MPSDRLALLARIFALPIVLGVATVVGLAAGLVADGAWDAVSAAALAVPLVGILVGPAFAQAHRR